MNKTDEIIELDLKQLFMALLKKAWLIALCAIIGGGGAFLWTKTMITPMYSANIKMYVNNTSISVGSTQLSISGSDITTAQKLVDTYIVILQTRTTLEAVIAELDLPYSYTQLSSMVSASAVNSTEIFQVNVSSPNPQEAMDIANTIANVLPMKIANIVDGSSVRVVDYAVLPTGAYSPSYRTNVMLGILLGMVLSGMLVVLQVIFNETIDSEDILTQNFEYPILTTIPDVWSEKSGGGYYKKSKKHGYYKKDAYYKTSSYYEVPSDEADSKKGGV